MKTIKQRGFSLIELLVVVAIIGVLAAAGIFAYTKYLDGTKRDSLNNYLGDLSKATQTDVLALTNNLNGRSDLLEGLATSSPTCQDLAIEMVKSINKKTKNLFDSTNPSAAYGNSISTSLSSNPKIYKGMTLVSCTVPGAYVSNADTYRLYQCACADDSCSWDAPATGDAFLDPDKCPQPPSPASVPGGGPCYGASKSSCS